MRSMTPQEVAALDAPVILDVREPYELERASVDGAIAIPMGEIVERVDELPDGTVHVLCHSGARSARVTEYLEQQGRDAVNIEGGIVAWAQAGLPYRQG
jgi:rhodanese-related sulfurtransferase